MTPTRSKAAAGLAMLLVDLATIHLIKDEAFTNSKVMDHLFCLDNVNGPRLINSPGQRAPQRFPPLARSKR